MPAGRPIEYNSKLHPKLVEQCYSNKMTNSEAAEYMEIALSTLHEWKNKYKEFSDAIERGKNKVDDEVENALLKKALGYEENAIKLFHNQGEVIEHPYVERFQPDFQSIRMWLHNRRRDKWSEKHDFNLSGELNIMHIDSQDEKL